MSLWKGPSNLSHINLARRQAKKEKPRRCQRAIQGSVERSEALCRSPQSKEAASYDLRADYHVNAICPRAQGFGREVVHILAR